jgi:hypothetical protein
LPVDFLGRMQCWWLFGFGKENLHFHFSKNTSSKEIVLHIKYTNKMILY